MIENDTSINILYIKEQFIINNIGDYYKEFENNAKAIYKQKIENNIVINQNDHYELLGNIIFSILERIKDEKQLDHFYIMAKEDKLCSYIRRSIYINCFSLKAPFLFNKKRFIYDNNLNSGLMDQKSMDSDTRKLNNMTDKQQELIKQVYKCLEPENAKRLFGTHWKYFVVLFRDYMNNPKGTYKKIALNYGVPMSSIQNHLQMVYKKIRNEIKINKK